MRIQKTISEEFLFCLSSVEATSLKCLIRINAALMSASTQTLLLNLNYLLIICEILIFFKIIYNKHDLNKPTQCMINDKACS